MTRMSIHLERKKHVAMKMMTRTMMMTRMSTPLEKKEKERMYSVSKITRTTKKRTMRRVKSMNWKKFIGVSWLKATKGKLATEK
jgi:hypothetical protein